MGRTPCSLNAGLNRGPWTLEEDLRLTNYIEAHGEGGWTNLPKKAGLLRCGKSCRLRWMNYLRPDVKRGHILLDEEDLILRLHRLLGNRWSLIAGRMPGRTDNEIKNYWNTHLSKKLLSQGIDPRTHKPLSESQNVTFSAPGDSETSQKSKQDKNTTIPGNIEESGADLQDEEEIAAQGNEDQAAATWPGNNANNQLNPESSLICNPQPVSVPISMSPQAPVISSTAFQESTSTCVAEAVSDSIVINHNKGSKQISFPLLNTACFNSSEQLAGVGRYDLDQYLMNNPVTSSNDMITSTVRLSSALQTAPFVGQFDSNQAFISGNALLNEKHRMSLQNLQALEMNPQHSFLVNPSEETIYNKLSHTSCAVPDQIAAACSYSYPVIPTAMGTALGDFNSDIFPSLLGSFGNEELQLQEPSTDTSIAQNVQLCPSSQPKAESLTSYDLWSMLAPSPLYHPYD